MSTAIAVQPEIASNAQPIVVSWEEFKSDYLEREDGYEYEWLDGVVEKSVISMDKLQFYILSNLQELFFKLKFGDKLDGQLIAEGDLFFKDNHRRPDVCWLTDEQIYRLAEGKYEVPAFIIEIISSTDAINRVNGKMQDYRAAGVKVVWHVFPIHKEVHVYSGETLNKMSVLFGEDLCTAAPALPSFQLSVNELFDKPKAGTIN